MRGCRQRSRTGSGVERFGIRKLFTFHRSIAAAVHSQRTRPGHRAVSPTFNFRTSTGHAGLETGPAPRRVQRGATGPDVQCTLPH